MRRGAGERGSPVAAKSVSESARDTESERKDSDDVLKVGSPEMGMTRSLKGNT